MCKQRALAWGIDAINLVMHSYFCGPNRAIDPQVRHIKATGAPWEPPTPPGRQGSVARGSGRGPGAGQGAGKERKCASHPEPGWDTGIDVQESLGQAGMG